MSIFIMNIPISPVCEAIIRIQNSYDHKANHKSVELMKAIREVICIACRMTLTFKFRVKVPYVSVCNTNTIT